MTKNDKIDPEPGRLVDWMNQQTQELSEEAALGQYSEFTINIFKQSLENYCQKFEAAHRADPDVLQDIDLVRLLLPGREEWIQRVKTNHERWRTQTANQQKNAQEYLQNMLGGVSKYMLLAYGAAFLMVFSGFINPSTKPEIMGSLRFATYILIGGFCLAIAFTWTHLINVKHVAEHARNMLDAWDSNDVKKTWLLRNNRVVDLLAFLAIIMFPLAGIAFVQGFDSQAFWNVLCDMAGWFKFDIKAKS